MSRGLLGARQDEMTAAAGLVRISLPLERACVKGLA